tara:strand:+ start:312 stop:464 length:153 start_codon:yes stop_codon:yes gene_type:complete
MPFYKATMSNDKTFPLWAVDDEDAAYRADSIANNYFALKLKDLKQEHKDE